MRYRAPQGPPCPHALGGDEEEWLTMHMGHRRHKHNMRQGLGPALARPLPPASPGKGPDFSPCPSLSISSKSTGKPRHSILQPQGSSPQRTASVLREWQGKLLESLSFWEICFQFPFTCHDSPKSQSCCTVIAAALPWEDPSSTQVHRPPAQLSPGPSSEELIPIPSSALAHSVWSLTDPKAVAAPDHPSPSQQGAQHPKRACPCESTPTLLMPWVHVPLGAGGPACTQPRLKGQRAITLAEEERQPWTPGTAEEGLRCSQRSWQKQAAPARGKGRKGERGEKPWRGLARMQILTSCHWKRREGNRNDGKVLSEARLHSWDPDLPPPPKGWAGACLSLLGSGHPSLPHQAQASCVVYGLHSS